MNHLKDSYNYKSIISIAIPIMLGNIAQTLITFVDTAFLGHIGRIELAAAMMAGLYYYVFSTLAWGFSVGIQIIVARRFGEKNLREVGDVYDHGLLVVLLLSLLLFLFMHFTTDFFLSKIISSAEIAAIAKEFMRFRHFGIIFVCFNFLFRSLYIGLSNTRIITYTTILMAIVNIFMDYCLIFGHFGFPQLGVAGAAIASVLAEFSALIFFILYTFRKLPIKEYGIFSFQNIHLKKMNPIISLSLPTMAQRLVSFGSWFLFFIFIERMGELSISVSSIIRSIYMLILVPAFAFGTTSNTLTSRLIGEGNASDVGILLKKILGISMGFELILVAGCLLFPVQIASIYTDDPILIQNTIPVLYIIAAATLVQSWAAIYFEGVSGTGNTLTAFFIESAILIFYISFTYLAAIVYHFPVQVVWCSELLYGVLLAVASMLYLHFANWNKKSI